MASKTKYTLTEEHRAQLKPWADRWIANALSTEPYTPEDHATIRDAVTRLYRAADLTPPPPYRILIVPSPFVARFAGGFAAAIWWLRGQSKKSSSTLVAMRDAAVATVDATLAATRVATWEATDAATVAATHAATDVATWEATDAATVDATWEATDAATGDATRAATMTDGWFRTLAPTQLRALAADIGGPEHTDLLLQCAWEAYRMWQGGNQWSGYAAYISFFRHIAHLPIDYTKWDPYEVLAQYGPRIVHEQFCLVSERPLVLTVDAESRPHNETGPFCLWRDGSALFAWHGVRVPARVIERPETLTVAEIDAETNAEVRRVMLDRFGLDRYITEAGLLPVHADAFGTLYRREDMGMVAVTNSTPEPDGSFKRYVLPVPPEMERAKEAVAWTFGCTEDEYAPVIES